MKIKWLMLLQPIQQSKFKRRNKYVNLQMSRVQHTK